MRFCWRGSRWDSTQPTAGFHSACWVTDYWMKLGDRATGALGLLVLACLIDVPRSFYVAGLIASVAIDLDHIPLYPGLLGTRTSARSRIPLPPCLSLPVPRLLSPRHRAVLAGVVTGLFDPFRAGNRRGSPGYEDALATAGHRMDRPLFDGSLGRSSRSQPLG